MDIKEKQQIMVDAANQVLSAAEAGEPVEVQEEIFKDAIFKITGRLQKAGQSKK